MSKNSTNNARKPHSVFEPETVRLLTAAMNEAWIMARSVGAVSTLDARDGPAAKLIAHRIMKLAQRGERDCLSLAQGGASALINSNLNAALTSRSWFSTANRPEHSQA